MRTSGSEQNLSRLALKQFQEDAKRYTEILNNLKRPSGASSSLQSNGTRNAVHSSQVKLRGLYPHDRSANATVQRSSTMNDLASMGK